MSSISDSMELDKLIEFRFGRHHQAQALREDIEKAGFIIPTHEEEGITVKVLLELLKEAHDLSWAAEGFIPRSVADWRIRLSEFSHKYDKVIKED